MLDWICFRNSDILQIGFQHVLNDSRLSLEEKGVFCHKEITAFFAKPWNIYAAPAGGNFSVLNNNTLIAWRREAVVDKVGECTPQIEDRGPLLHHLGDDLAAAGFFLFGQGQILCIRIRRMKIEGNGPDISGIPGGDAYVPHCVLVDLIDGHIETDIVRRGVLYIFHDGIIGISANGIMAFPVSVKTEQN